MEIIKQAIDKLSNSMRLYSEVCTTFDRLKSVDAEEAIDNLDRAFEAKLEAFHSLYDVSKSEFDYFNNADTALLILLRNAIHHRDHTLFHSWNYEMFHNSGLKRNSGAAFLMASHIVNGSEHTAKYFYKVDDFFERIDESKKSPYLENKMGNKNREKLLNQINEDLNFSSIMLEAVNERYPSNQVYINVVPIFISAMTKIFSCFKNKGVDFSRFDSHVYVEHFTKVMNIDFENIEFTQIRLP
ncbi:hypothetical protein [Pseudoalteromonas luteoviolacea]|uniref:hypothetical protein n=1 Tax=Pseudoalteromonas luteoviolacea TaxID=43657 RepID=UPI00114D93D9|nr:hypothetical protein [Pseudoalteromonas luteoviolacea]TQF70458.1 hypothetical protein FLM44_05020 [Pseudoalteromonas luteoviolacea]